MPANDSLIILGPTASGKTALGVALARLLEGEIISADSRQVYRGLDIGTGKDLHEFDLGGPQVAHHLIDIVEPGTEYNVFRFQRDFHAAFADIRSRSKLPVVVGGTGMYLDAALSKTMMIPVPHNPELRAAMEPMSTELLQEKLIRREDVTVFAMPCEGTLDMARVNQTLGRYTTMDSVDYDDAGVTITVCALVWLFFEMRAYKRLRIFAFSPDEKAGA